jgi:predicted methyltransferase
MLSGSHLTGATMTKLWYLRFMLLALSVGDSGTAGAASPLPSYIDAAVADSARPASQVALDAWRRPAEVIAYAGIKPGDRLADFMSGNAYFTRIFSRIVGPQGKVYAYLPTQQLATCSPEETAGTREIQGDPHYSNVEVIITPSNEFAAPELLDAVWMSQDYHDLHDKFMRPTDVAAVNSAIFKALKPGGIYLIIDHVARSGSGLRDTETLHRIDPASIRAEVTAAGFRFESQSEILRNPNDAHVLPVFDKAIRYRTDQIILKFRKPR